MKIAFVKCCKPRCLPKVARDKVFKRIRLPLVIFLLTMPFSLLAQITVTGIVKDANGNPLQGVSVLLQGTSTGTSTGNGGKFAIALPALRGTLEFSMVGYTTKYIQLKDSSELLVVLDASDSKMDA